MNLPTIPNFRHNALGPSLVTRLKLCAFWCVIGLVLTIGTASAQTITIYSTSGGSNTLPTNIPFTLLNLGSSSTANTEVQSTTVTTSSSPAQLPSGSEITQIAFGTTSVSGSTPSAVYAGGVSGDGASPLGSTNTKTDYLAAGGSGGTVTVSYSVTQDALQILWGSADSGTTNNVLTFKNSTGATVATITGTQIATAVGSGFVSGVTNVALRIKNLPGFTSLVLSDANGAAFEFVLGLPVPEPATIAVFGVGVTGITLTRRRRKARIASTR